MTAGPWWHSSTTTRPYAELSLRQVLAGRGLGHGDVDDALGPILPATELSNLVRAIDAEMLDEAVALLFDERLAVHNDQGGHLMMGNELAGDDGLACSWRRDENAEPVAHEHRGGLGWPDSALRTQCDLDPLGFSSPP